MSIYKADIVITVSENSKKDLIRILNVNPSKIRIIYNFIEKQSKITPNIISEKFIHTVSTIQPGKNLIKLITAYNNILQFQPDLKLYIIGGKGWLYQNIFDCVDRLGLNEKVLFTDYVSENKLLDYYANSKGLVYVSLYEGFGIPPLEAMLYDCPVVVSDVSSLPEVVGDAGIMVDPNDIESISTGIMMLFDEEVIKLKKEIYPTQINKFQGKVETEKFLTIIQKLYETKI